MEALLNKATAKDDSPPPVSPGVGRMRTVQAGWQAAPCVRSIDFCNTRSPPPPQGWVLPELAKITHSDLGTCDKMADWLVERLKKPEASIKWKTLLVMKQVSRSGRPEFRRCLQRHAEAIKACLREYQPTHAVSAIVTSLQSRPAPIPCWQSSRPPPTC